MWVQSRRLGGAREIVTADLRKATSRLTQTMPVCRGRPEVFPYPDTIWQIEHALWSPSNTNRKRVWEAAKEPLYGWCFWGSLLSSLAYFYSWNTSSFLLKNKPTNQVSSTEMELHLFPLLPLPRGPTSHSTSTPSISHPTLKLIAFFSLLLLLLHTYTGRSMYVCICMHR